jgi:hypothetical protein
MILKQILVLKYSIFLCCWNLIIVFLNSEMRISELNVIFVLCLSWNTKIVLIVNITKVIIFFYNVFFILSVIIRKYIFDIIIISKNINIPDWPFFFYGIFCNIRLDKIVITSLFKLMNMSLWMTSHV